MWEIVPPPKSPLDFTLFSAKEPQNPQCWALLAISDGTQCLLPVLCSPACDLSSESALRIRWPKYWSFSFNVSHSNEYPGLISFRMDSFDLLVIQGTLDWEGKELVKKGLEFASTWASGCFLGGSVVKNLPANAGDTDLIPGLGRAPGKGNGNLLQCCCLGNPTEIPQSLVGYSPWRYKESDTT